MAEFKSAVQNPTWWECCVTCLIDMAENSTVLSLCKVLRARQRKISLYVLLILALHRHVRQVSSLSNLLLIISATPEELRTSWGLDEATQHHLRVVGQPRGPLLTERVWEISTMRDQGGIPIRCPKPPDSFWMQTKRHSWLFAPCTSPYFWGVCPASWWRKLNSCSGGRWSVNLEDSK